MSDRSAVVEELVLDYGWELLAAPPGGPVLMRYIGTASHVAAQVSSEGSLTLMVSRSATALEGEWVIEFGPEVPDSLVVRCVAEATEYA